MTQDIRIPELTPAAGRFSIQWAASRRNAHRARTAAAGQLRAWGLPHEAAAHIVAELTANAVTHGRVPGRDFRLTLVASATVLRIEVADARGDRLPVAAREADDAAESGRGLLLVAALADRWGVTSGPSPTKTVWAELDLPPSCADPALTS
ncbi:ATP-binding protein [Streptomyces sp. V4-01]|uniref:ATP-binding protein n=1 Tax=Actinacidiphila polyblastidii TaxID=3110430 RepID=A0ABU7P7S3_9ACTN|nr:ATP-binding protein [Streptomyces sp. V4-01]